MKLELVGEEVLEFMTLKQTIIDMNNYINDLKTALSNEYFKVETDYSYEVNTDLEEEYEHVPRKRWTKEELKLLTEIRNKNGIYSNYTPDEIVALFPNRTFQAVRTALRRKDVSFNQDKVKYKVIKNA